MKQFSQKWVYNYLLLLVKLNFLDYFSFYIYASRKAGNLYIFLKYFQPVLILAITNIVKMFFAIGNKQCTSPHDLQQQHPRRPTTGFVLFRLSRMLLLLIVRWSLLFNKGKLVSCYSPISTFYDLLFLQLKVF